MSFDVYGTLVDVRGDSYGAFERILAASGAGNLDVKEFWEYWERRNIAQYWQPYKSYREICQTSLAETFVKFGLRGEADLINYYFDAFTGFRLYADVPR